MTIGPEGMSRTGADLSSPSVRATSLTAEPTVDATTETGSSIGLRVTPGEGQISRFTIIAKHTSFLRIPRRNSLRNKSPADTTTFEEEKDRCDVRLIRTSYAAATTASPRELPS
jgi:hypothetical protein